MKNKYIVLIRALTPPSPLLYDSEYDSFEEAFHRARVLRRESKLPVIIAEVKEVYD